MSNKPQEEQTRPMIRADHYLKWRKPTETESGQWVCVCGKGFGNSITLGWQHLGLKT